MNKNLFRLNKFCNLKYSQIRKSKKTYFRIFNTRFKKENYFRFWVGQMEEKPQ